MDRTPIRIPGKNMRDTSKAAVAARKALNRPRGRPFKLASTTTTKLPGPSDIPIEPANKPKKRSLKHIKSRRKLSDLEKLPTELLVDIFLYSMNLDLPRSSPVIGGQLKSDLVYTRTIIEAFGPTWDEGYCNYMHIPQKDGEIEDPLIGLQPGTILKARGVGDGDLQSAILRCRWASLSIVQKSQEIWIKRHCQDRTFRPLPFVINPLQDGERELPKERLERKLTPAQYFDEDFEAFSIYTQSIYPRLAGTHHWNTYVDVAKGLEIPENLLLGPWTEEMTKFLYWLVKGGAQFDWLNSTSGEVAMLGLKKAVVDGELRVIHLLFWAGLHESVDIKTIVWVIHNAGGNKVAVVMLVLSLWLERYSFSLHEQSLLEMALTEVEEKGLAESDIEKVDMVAYVHEVYGST